MKRTRSLAIVPTLSILFLVPLLFVTPLAQADESVSARLIDIDASYGQEVWKYDASYEGVAGPAQKAEHIQNRTATYYGALGLRGTFQVQLYDPQDPGRKVLDAAYNMTGFVQTPRGPLYAYVKRAPVAGPGPSNSDTFYLDLDFDGSNNGDPLGRYPPALDAGFKILHIDITKRQQDVPPTRLVGSAEHGFLYEIPSTTVSIPSLGALPFLQSAPDGIYRLYNDIGWGQSVLFVDRAVAKTASVQVSYQFGAPNLPVKLYGFLAERGASTPAGTQPVSNPSAPFIPGVTDNKTLQNQLEKSDALIVVNKKLLTEGLTGPDGSVTFQVTGDDLLKIRPTAPGAALVVLAPLLDPTPQDPRIGATELVVPVSDSRNRVERYRLLETSGGATNLPDAAKSYGLAVNGLQVDILDVDGFTNQNPPQVRTGDLFALVPDVRNNQALSGASLAPTQSDVNLLRGTLPVRPIQEQGVSYYRVLALLYRENDAFYGVTFGDRGYQLDLAAAPAVLGTPANLLVNLNSRTTDYDLLPGERDFDLKVYVRVWVKDLNYNRTASYTLTEAGVLSLTLPFTSNRTGDVRVDVASTSGDVTPRDLRVNLVFQDPPVKKGLADKLPGFDAILLLVALAVTVAAYAARRRA